MQKTGQTISVFITDYNFNLLRKYIKKSPNVMFIDEAINHLIEYSLDREGPLPPFPMEKGKRST